MKKYLSQIILIAILAAALGFGVGSMWQRGRGFKADFGQFGDGRGQMMFKGDGKITMGIGGQKGLRPVAGEIIKVEGESITVKMPDGSSKIVILSDSTEIGESTVVSADKLVVGANVVIFGDENSDGSVTAQNVQLNPDFKGR